MQPPQDEESGKAAPPGRSIVGSAYKTLSTLTGNIPAPTWSISGWRPSVSPAVGFDLLYYDLDPKPEELDHYSNIKLRLRGKIARITRDRHAKSCAIQPMVFGENEADVKLHVVVHCEPRMEDEMNEMFTSSVVQNLLKLSEDRSLGFLVIPDNPCLRASHVDIDVCSQTGYTSRYHTYCGAPTIFRDCLNQSDLERRAWQGISGV